MGEACLLAEARCAAGVVAREAQRAFIFPIRYDAGGAGRTAWSTDLPMSAAYRFQSCQVIVRELETQLGQNDDLL